jgi:hypothetical protein
MGLVQRHRLPACGARVCGRAHRPRTEVGRACARMLAGPHAVGGSTLGSQHPDGALTRGVFEGCFWKCRHGKGRGVRVAAIDMQANKRPKRCRSDASMEGCSVDPTSAGWCSCWHMRWEMQLMRRPCKWQHSSASDLCAVTRALVCPGDAIPLWLCLQLPLGASSLVQP